MYIVLSCLFSVGSHCICALVPDWICIIALIEATVLNNSVVEWNREFCLHLSLKDDDSGDHDQDNCSPKDGEKEKNDGEEKDSNTTKRKVCRWMAERQSRN